MQFSFVRQIGPAFITAADAVLFVGASVLAVLAGYAVGAALLLIWRL